MRTSRFSRRALASERGGTCGRPRYMTGLAISLAATIVLAGCSSSSSGSNQAASSPPPNLPAGDAGQPTYVPRGQAAYPPPGQSAPARPGGEPPVATAVSSPGPDASDLMPYPKQSLFDLFRGSSESPPAAVPHPPGTYAPAGQPSTPPTGQPSNTTPGSVPAGAPPAAPAQTANTDPSDLMPYPKQSLFDLFSNKPAAQ